jgi:hypothetical protein
LTAELEADLKGSLASDGYFVFPSILSDAAVAGVLQEVGGRAASKETGLGKDWAIRGSTADRMLADPLVLRLLDIAFLGHRYQFDHAGFATTARGTPPIRFHQDDHHFRHDAPANVAERGVNDGCGYFHLLWYPTGFKGGDACLQVFRASHKTSLADPLALEPLPFQYRPD